MANEQQEDIIIIEQSLPVNYVEIMNMVPEFSQIEEKNIEEKINETTDIVHDSLKKLYCAGKGEQENSAKLICCLRFFELGQLCAQKAQIYFTGKDINNGIIWLNKAKEKYKKIEEYEWDNILKKSIGALRLNNMLESAEQTIFSYYKQKAIVFYLEYRQKVSHRNSLAIADEDKELLKEFLIAYERANNFKKGDFALLSLKFSFLCCLWHESDDMHKEISSIEKELVIDASEENKNRNTKLIMDITLKKLRMSSLKSDKYDDFVPKNKGDDIRDFFSNVFLESEYEKFNNHDLTIFKQNSYPTNKDIYQGIEFGLVNIPISIGDIYKFMAHFRNITSRFRYAADPSLNRAILLTLYKAKLINEKGDILPKEEVMKDIIDYINTKLPSIYRSYFPNIKPEDISLDFYKIKNFIEEQKKLISHLYDGFSPEMSLLLLGKSLQVIERVAYSNKAKDAMNLIHDSLLYRHQLRAGSVFSNELAAMFVKDLFEIVQKKMLLISCPTLAGKNESESVERHAIFIIFHKKDNEIKIQIINGGLGADQFHCKNNNFDIGYVRKFVLNLGQRSSLEKYVEMLFNLSEKSVTTLDELLQSLSQVYSPFQFKEFEYNMELNFPTQVAGNCTVFGAQWALNIALGLTKDEHDKLTLDFARGCDILATHIRKRTPISDLENLPLISYQLYDHTVTFPCGYTSISRSKIKQKKENTLDYIPVSKVAVPGAKHHIIPQSYLQFLYDKLYNTSDKNLLCQVLGKPDSSDVAKRKFIYGNFCLFHGPQKRTDDPEDSKNDLYGGIETKCPKGFPADRWSALQTIGQTLKQLLTTDKQNYKNSDEIAAIDTCKNKLQEIARDASRTNCFVEKTPGEVWEEDLTEPNSYRLKL